MTRHFYDYRYLDGSFDALRQVMSGPPESWLPSPARREGSSIIVDLSDGTDATVAAAVAVGRPRYDEVDQRYVVPISWHAAEHAALYPKLDASIELSPMSRDRAQLVFTGAYDVPAGTVGEVVDRAVGHTFVEAVVHDLLRRVAARLELAVSTLTG